MQNNITKSAKCTNNHSISTLLFAALLSLMVAAPAMAARHTGEITTTMSSALVAEADSINGKQVTPQQKAVARKMAQHGAQMARQGAQMAVTALTHPSKIDSVAKRMDAIGEKLEELGDSLAAMSEDTTFLYMDEDSLLSDSDDLDDFINGMADEWDSDFTLPTWLTDTWWGKGLAGLTAIIISVMAVALVALVIVLLFLFFTAPLWLIGLIIWLIVRNDRKVKKHNPTPSPETPKPENTPTDDTDMTGIEAMTDEASNVFTGTDMSYTASDEKQQMWKSGIMYSCVGVGLITVFISIGASALWGIGALVACIGVAKLIIAKS